MQHTKRVCCAIARPCPVLQSIICVYILALHRTLTTCNEYICRVFHCSTSRCTISCREVPAELTVASFQTPTRPVQQDVPRPSVLGDQPDLAGTDNPHNPELHVRHQAAVRPQGLVRPGWFQRVPSPTSSPIYTKWLKHFNFPVDAAHACGPRSTGVGDTGPICQTLVGDQEPDLHQRVSGLVLGLCCI